MVDTSTVSVSLFVSHALDIFHASSMTIRHTALISKVRTKDVVRIKVLPLAKFNREFGTPDFLLKPKPNLGAGSSSKHPFGKGRTVC